MKGVAFSKWGQSVEQEPPLLLLSHSVEFDNTSSREANSFPLNSNPMRILAAFFVVAAMMLLIALARRCFIPRSRVSTSGLRRRRLASGGEKQGEGNDRERQLACRDLENLLGAQAKEDFTSYPPPPQPTGTSVGAGAEGEQPAKKKRKTKHLKEDTDETSEQQAKRAREYEWNMDPLETLELLLPPFGEPNPTSSPAPPFILEQATHSDLAMREEPLTTGETTASDRFFVVGDHVPSTTEEERRPQKSPYFSPLECTSGAFFDDSISSAMQSLDFWAFLGDMEMPSTSGAVSGVQSLSSQPPLPHVSQPSQVPQSVSRPEGSAAPPGQMTLMPFSPFKAPVSTHACGGLVKRLKPLEILLRKNVHSQQDLQDIIRQSETVYAYGLMYMTKPSVGQRQFHLVRLAATRFLVLDALWCACEAVGPAMRKSEWWIDFARSLYGNEWWWVPNVARQSFRVFIYEETVAALRAFSQGRRLSADRIASLKKNMFDRANGFPNLKSVDWDFWRPDDES